LLFASALISADTVEASTATRAGDVEEVTASRFGAQGLRLEPVSLMSFVKHRRHDWDVLHARQREVDLGADRAEERTGPEDVGDQTLMRGLDTALPFVRPGLSLSVGRASIM
jgi:hypothetical protein